MAVAWEDASENLLKTSNFTSITQPDKGANGNSHWLFLPALIFYLRGLFYFTTF